MEEHLSALPEAWQLAIRREIESHAFYERMASSTSDASLKALFTSLAAEEVKHKERLESEYRRHFEADLDQPGGRTGVFEHALPKAQAAYERARPPPLVSWYEWGAEAFRLAQQLDVPILLSIGAVWCHWCHVMDSTTFSDPEVASLITRLFVPIRVDTDMRPDVNTRYNMGGWPTVAFLTPTGEALTGSTYMSPAAFRDALKRVSDYYRDNRQAIQERVAAAESRRLLQAPDGYATGQRAMDVGEIDMSAPEAVFRATEASYDQEFGGFGSEPKFPQADVIELLLARHRRTHESRPLEMATTTLRAMAQGGMYDHEAGGFFRYSTTRDWSVPHFEKMLEDNARLLSVYLHAYQCTGDAQFRATAEGILSYVGSTLQAHETGCFYGSQDADEEYYALPLAEREHRPAPFVDRQVYVSWNGMMALAYLEAGAIMERPELANTALAALRFLWKGCWQPGQGMCHYWDGQAHLFGLLADQAWTAQAMLHAYEYTASPEYLQHAEEILRWVHDKLLTPAGSFQDLPPGGEALGRLGQSEVPLTENAAVAAALARLHRLTAYGDYLDWARAALQAFAAGYGRHGYFAAAYALAVEQVLNEPLRAVIVGSADDAQTFNLLRAAWRACSPHRSLQVVDPLWETERLRALGYPAQPSPAAYICLGQTCAEPVTTADAVVLTINQLYASQDKA